MGRHSSVNEEPQSVSTRLIVIIVLVIAVILAVIGWVVFGPSSDSDDSAQKCSEGELVLPIAESSPGIAQSLIDAYAATNPVQGKKCVTLRVTPDIATAALYISQGDPRPAVKKVRRTVVDPINPVQVPLGVNVLSSEEMYSSADQIVYPVATDGEAAAVAATYLSNSVDNGTMLLQRDAQVTLEQAMEEKHTYIVAPYPLKGYTFHPMRATSTIDAAVLASTDTVTKDQVSAATAMITFATEKPAASDVKIEDVHAVQKNVGMEIRPVTPPAPVSSSAPESQQKPADQKPVAKALDTLFLLDTSDAMAGENFTQASGAIKELSRSLAVEGIQVALWNYSSPLNPGVTKGWRDNVSFGNGETIPTTLDGFGTGGYPQTRSAVVAALQAANAHAQETGAAVNILVITTGTQEDIPDPDFMGQLDGLANDKVTLKVLHLAPGAEDAVLKERASEFRTINNPAELRAAGAQILGVQEG